MTHRTMYRIYSWAGDFTKIITYLVDNFEQGFKFIHRSPDGKNAAYIITEFYPEEVIGFSHNFDVMIRSNSDGEMNLFLDEKGKRFSQR